MLLASVAVQVLRILQAWMLGRALGLLLPVGPYFIYVPIILLLMLLPITISGLGVAQYGFVTLFDRVAVPAPEAIALSILFIALGVIGNLPGAVLYPVPPEGGTRMTSRSLGGGWSASQGSRRRRSAAP